MKLLTIIFFLVAGTVMFAQTKESNCCSDSKKDGSVTKKMCEVPETTSQVEVKKEMTVTSTAPATTIQNTKNVETKREVGKQEKVLVKEQKKKDCCTVDKTETVKGKEKD